MAGKFDRDLGIKVTVETPPADPDQLAAANEVLQARHPGVRTIVRDYESVYHSWGLLAGEGGCVFGRTGRDYDLHDAGVATPGAVHPSAA